MCRRLVPLLLVFCLTIFSSAVNAEEDTARLRLTDDTISPGRKTLLELQFPSDYAGRTPDIPIIEGLDIKFSETRKIPDGASGTNKIFVYVIVPRKEGRFTIGPFELWSNGRQYITDQVLLDASKAHRKTPAHLPVAGPSENISDHIFMQVSTDPEKPYVNQLFNITIKFYTDWLDIKDLNISDTLSEKFITSKYTSEGSFMKDSNGRKYAVLLFKKSLFITGSGKRTLGPVTATFNIVKPAAALLVPSTADFYKNLLGSRDKRVVKIGSEPVILDVLPVPTKGRPPSYRRAVGDFDLNVTATPTRVKKEDIITLTVKITGVGNFDIITVPDPGLIRGSETVSSDTKRTPEEVTLTRKIKVISSDLVSIPEVSFSFFDPLKGIFVVKKNGPFPLENMSAPGSEQVTGKDITSPSTRVPSPEKSIVLRKSPGRPVEPYHAFHTSRLFYGLRIFPFFLIVFSVALKERIRKVTEDRRYISLVRSRKIRQKMLPRAEKALKNEADDVFYRQMFLFLQEYFGARFDLPHEGLTEENLKPVLDRADPTSAVYNRVKTVIQDCYATIYSGKKNESSDMKKTFNEVREITDLFNRDIDL